MESFVAHFCQSVYCEIFTLHAHFLCTIDGIARIKATTCRQFAKTP